MSVMFLNCKSLTTLDISYFDVASVTSKNFIFSNRLN